MAVVTRMTEQEYQELALSDPDGQWELWDGVPRRKPDMSFEHNDAMFELGLQLGNQLDRTRYRARVNAGRLRRSGRNHFVPDVAALPVDLTLDQRGRPGLLETYAAPLPFVAEIWSLPTGEYDLTVKIGEYRRRGDAEIWRLNPYERTLTVWRRQPDGSYEEAAYTGGVVPIVSLPGVAIDLDALLGG